MTSNAAQASDIAQLQIISQYVNTTLDFLLLSFGLVGNLLNILTLITLGNYKHNASSLYILVKSFLDLTALFINLFTLILNLGFRINSISTNFVWCKIRSPLIYVIAFCSCTCICLHSIDTFLATSHSVYWRQKSNIRTARISIIGFLFLWIVHELPEFFFQDLINLKCVSTNAAYTQYRTYFIPFGLLTVIPIGIVSIFGYLSYRQLHREHLQVRQRTLPRLTRQMTIMAIFQIINLLVFTTPFAISTAYFLVQANFVKDAYLQAQQQFAQLFFSVLLYGIYAVRFTHSVSHIRL